MSDPCSCLSAPSPPLIRSLLRLAQSAPSPKQVLASQQSHCHSVAPVSQWLRRPARRAPHPGTRCPPAALPRANPPSPLLPPPESCPRLHPIRAAAPRAPLLGSDLP